MKLKLITLLISISCWSQNYKIQYNALLKYDLDKELAERSKSFLNLENVAPINYELYILNGKSFFVEKKTMPLEGEENNYNLRKNLSDGGLLIVYQNDQEGKVTRQINRRGEYFLIEENYEDFEWEITGKEKQFDNFIAYEAITNIDIIGRNLERVKQTIIAYFITDVPIPVGPIQYGGLPGLIVELHIGGTVFQATSIETNPQSIPKFEIPSRGQKLTSEYEFQKIISEQRKK